MKDSKYHISSTSDVYARFEYHNSGKQRSTRARILFELILFESYDSKQAAVARERQIKSWKEGMAFKRLI